jgi:hypothetical protein
MRSRPAIANSRAAPISKGNGGAGPWSAQLAVTGLLSLLSAAAVLFFSHRGWLLYYGDAEAHLNIARRILDSRTPGYDQLGTAWLPLPHVLMLPFVGVDAWWRSGLAGAIPSAVCFILAGSLLFAAARRIFGSVAPAAAAAALFALNPNILYLQSAPMTEPVFDAALMAVLYATVRFRESQGWLAAACAGLAVSAAALARYEGWFLIPFVAAYVLFAARRHRVSMTLLFCALAALGPLYWLVNNWWLTGDALDFYRGPYSPRAIQGAAPYPGRNNWSVAWLYYRTAVELAVGPALAIMALGGAVVALARRIFWPLALLGLPALFYILSLHSSGTPIFLPTLWPNSYYNSRYGLAALPLVAFAAAGLTCLPRLRVPLAILAIAAGSVYWLVYPQPRSWVTWEESRVNSEARRGWTRQAADYLAPRFVPGSGIVTSFGDMTGIFRQAGIPLRETFTGDNGLPWVAALRRPRPVLTQQWGVAMAGDAVDRALAAVPDLYALEKVVIVKGAPEIRIYHRTGSFPAP